jgi:hypothetical protein
MRIFNLQGLGAPEKPKKKIKYAEIDFTSHHRFLRVTHPNVYQSKVVGEKKQFISL